MRLGLNFEALGALQVAAALLLALLLEDSNLFNLSQPPMLATPVIFAARGGFVATLTLIQILNVAVAVLAVAAGAIYLARSAFGRSCRIASARDTAE